MKRKKKFDYPQYFIYYGKRRLLIKYLIKRHYKRRGGQFENFSPSSHHRYVQMQGLLFWQCPGAYVQGE